MSSKSHREEGVRDPSATIAYRHHPDVDRESGRHAEAVFETVSPPASTGLLSFYDRLRQRIVQAVESHGGKLGSATAEALLLVPDIFILLARMSLDKEVPRASRALMAGALAYFVLPADLLPEAVIGVGGYLEDLVLAVAVLAQAMGGELEPYAEKYWSGSKQLRQVLRDIVTTAHSLLGENLYRRLKQLLARRGIDLEEPQDPEAAQAPSAS